MKPYYEDEAVTLYHADSLAWLRDRETMSVDAVITDPPFDARTHSMARTNKTRGHGNRAIEFAHMDHAAQLALFADLGRITRRWVVSNVASDTAFRFEVEGAPDGLRLLRVGAWIKTNPMPMISADRPGMGWETLVYLHRVDVKPVWSGGGRSANFVCPTSQGSGHPTQKPLGMVAQWVRWFTEPGDLVLDPFAGSGTTLRAAKDEGRKAIGIELDERYCEIAARRLSQDALFGDLSA